MRDQLLEEVLKEKDGSRRVRALREELQYLILRLLSQSGFFLNFAFVGGTALRILYDLRRFSEDLDFSAVPGKERTVSLKPYYDSLFKILGQLGFSVAAKNKNIGAVHSSFLKFSDLWWRIDQGAPKNQILAVKIEADCNPPLHAVVEASPVQRKHLFNILHYDLPSLFAGKLCALMHRKYTKGRDWYDFVWYRTRKVSVNGRHLSAGHLQARGEQVEVGSLWLAEQLKRRIQSLDLEIVKRDMRPFLENASELEIFSKETLVRLADDIEVIG
ncbi:MAG: nucleotidyl transferase AbiEii/AbiGii toxin family protein [Elusimicrobia bacterium]|nr:nucleotidyl transferase AbiEii/AbiGii toxin family protein [Elusimicrobiota bacterium]